MPSNKKHFVHCILETACGCRRTLTGMRDERHIDIALRYPLTFQTCYEFDLAQPVPIISRRFEFYKEQVITTNEAIIEERYYREVLS